MTAEKRFSGLVLATSLAFFVALLVPFGTIPAVAPAKLDPDLPHQARKVDPVSDQVDHSVVVTAPARPTTSPRSWTGGART